MTGTASISGLVWNDADGDGARGAAEPAASGITVYLDLNNNNALDTGEPTKTTAADGSYSFANLDAGNYIVRHVPPLNDRITSPTVSGQRLFAVDTSTNPDRIVELNPTTGVELHSFAAPVASSSEVGLAFDGQTLYFLSDSNDTLYELNAATGAVLDSTVLASGFYGGLASLAGKVYVLNWSSRVVSIFDPATNAVTTGYDLDSVNPLFFTTHGLGNATATGELLAATTDGSVAFVNAATGVKNSSFAVDNSNSIGSIEAIGDDVFVGYSFTNRLEVYSRTTHAFVRPLNLSFSPKETAGWGDTSGAQRVTLAAGQAATSINFGDQYTLVSIAGTRWQDTNGNGVHDFGEPPLPGKTMYLDVNDNGQHDTGEPTAVTASDGSYLFSSLAIGKYVVREDVTTTYQQTFPAIARKRLFVTDVFQNKIVELDPQTGAVLHSLPTPINSQIFNGLAFDGQTLYFVSNDNDILYKMDPDSGAVIGQTTLPSGSYQELAYLNGLVFIRVMNSAFIKAFDPVTNTIVNTITVTGIPSAYIYYGLGEMTGPDRILSRDLQDEVFTIDPATGATTVLFTLKTSDPYGLTSVGQEIFAGYSGGSNGQIDVYSRSGTLLRSFNNATTPAAFALAGMQWTDTAQRVTLGYGQNATGLDFGTTEPALPSTEVSLAGSNITISDATAGNDNWRLERSGTDIKLTDLGGGTIDASTVPGASGSGTSIVTFPLSLMQPAGSLVVNGGDGNDTLTIDLSGGNPIPPGGITYAGGNPATAPGDKLTINGGNQGTVTYNYAGAHDGSIVMSSYGTVTYSGLEPVINTGTASELIFNLTGANVVTLGDDGVSGNGLSRLSAQTIETTDFANPTGSVTINRGSAGDPLAVSALPDFTAGLTIGSASNPFSAVTFAGAVSLAAGKSMTAYASSTISLPNAASQIATTSTGAISLTTARDISLAAGSALTTVNGDLTLSANQQATPTSGGFSGVTVNGGTVQSTGTGNITISGRGGTSGGNLIGVWVTGGGVIEGGTDGMVQITGTGGSSSGSVKPGVRVHNAGSRIGSSGADIVIRGFGGAFGSFNRGVDMFSGGQIVAGGAGTVTVTGTGGITTGNENQGVLVNGDDTGISSVSGDVTITGTGGGSGAAINNAGVGSVGNGYFGAGGTGSLVINGTAGNPATVSNAVVITPGGATAGGSIMLNGIPVNDSGWAVKLGGIVTPGAGGNVLIVGDRLTIDTGGGINAPTQSVTINPQSASKAIDLGGADSASSLGLADDELDLVLARTLIIGDGNSGPLTVTSDISRQAATDIVLTSGGSIKFATGSLNTGGGNLTLSPGPGDNVGAPHGGIDTSLAATGKVSFAVGSRLAIALGGTVADSQYDQFNTVGLVDLTGVSLVLSGTYAPYVGDQFVIVKNDGSDAVAGAFNGLPEGQVFHVTSGGLDAVFAITYAGGDGNDVVLTAVNSAPAFFKGGDQSATDEAGPETIPAWATAVSAGSPGESAQHLHFSIQTNSNSSLFAKTPAIGPDGTLTFTPAPNADGSARIAIVLQDDGGTALGGADTSSVQTFTITITKPHVWHNTQLAVDVNGDDTVAPIDALLVINYINSNTSDQIPPDALRGPPYCDVDNDGFIAPKDALQVINYINAHGNQAQAHGEGEAAAQQAEAELLWLLALDVSAQPKRRL